MGKTFSQEKLFHDIDAHNLENIKYILLKYPHLVNEYFDQE